MRHERCRLNPRYMTEYGAKLGSLAINTAQVIKHEVFPPKPDLPKPLTETELVILDDENAVIRQTPIDRKM